MSLSIEADDAGSRQELGSVHSSCPGDQVLNTSHASSPSFSSSVPTAQRSMVRREVRTALSGALQHPQDELQSVQSTATINDPFDGDTHSASIAVHDAQLRSLDGPEAQPAVGSSSNSDATGAAAARPAVSDLSLLSLQSDRDAVMIEGQLPRSDDEAWAASAEACVKGPSSDPEGAETLPVAERGVGSGMPEDDRTASGTASSSGMGTGEATLQRVDPPAVTANYLSVAAAGQHRSTEDRSGGSFLSGLDVPPMSDSSVFHSDNIPEHPRQCDDSPHFQHRPVGATPRKSSVSIAVPQVTSPVTAGSQAIPDWSKRSILSVSPMSTHPGPRLPPLDISEELDEAALRRKIEMLSAELGNRLLHGSQPRSPPRHASESLGTTMMQGTTSRLHHHMPVGGSASAADGRKLRDGLIAMSTEARNEDLKTILCKREIVLTEALDEQLALQKKLQFLNQDVSGLAAQKTDLEALRHNHHVDMTMLKSDLSAVNKELNNLRWTEGHVHQEISDLTNSLQRYRHKRSREELKRLQELNTVTYELQTLEKAIQDETNQYQEEWSRLRKELRAIQEEIVTFKPHEWLAAAVAAGMQKKVAAAEFDGDARKAHQYASASLAGAGRRNTVANIERERSDLDAFLHGGRPVE